MTLWATMVVAGLVTFAIRYSFIGSAGRGSAPRWFVEALRFVPVAALSALIWPDLLLTGQGLDPLQPRLVAGLVAAVVAWRSRSVLATIGGGMLALWILQWLA